MHPKADVPDIAFEAQSLLAIEKRETKPTKTNDEAESRKQYGKLI